MFCRKCGSHVHDTAQFCPNCGAAQTQNLPVKAIGFLEAVKMFFARYTDFRGRSRRSEYWWVCLFNTIVGGIIGAILPDFAWIWSLVILVPTLALCVRRLHDVGKSGWFYLWVLLPLAGIIIILIQFLKDSTPDNQWGPNPKGYRAW